MKPSYLRDAENPAFVADNISKLSQRFATLPERRERFTIPLLSASYILRESDERPTFSVLTRNIQRLPSRPFARPEAAVTGQKFPKD